MSSKKGNYLKFKDDYKVKELLRGLTGEVSVTCLVYKENKHWEGLSLKLLLETHRSLS